MDPAIEHMDLTPPQQSELRRGLVPAIVANVLLVVALGASLQWKRGPAEDAATMGAPAAVPAEPAESIGPPASAALPASATRARSSAAARPARRASGNPAAVSSTQPAR